MAIKESGVLLVAKQYSDYLAKMRNIEQAHRKAFNPNIFSKWNKAQSSTASSARMQKANVDSTWQAVQNLRNNFNSASTAGSRFGSVGDKVSGAFQNLKSRLSGASNGITSLITSFGKSALAISGVMALVQGLSSALQFFQGAGEIAQRVETLSVALNEVGDQAGYSKQQIDFAVESLRNQGITTQVSSKALLRMARANISWAEATKLAAIAQGSAVVAGMNSSDAFDRLVTGIQKMEPELLDELGITLNRTNAYKKLADELGINATSLTQAQKQQAILNDIYAQSESVIAVYDAALETSGKQQGSLSRKIEETQLNVGNMLLPLKAASVQMQTKFWNAAQQASKGASSLGSALAGVIQINTVFTSTLSTTSSSLLKTLGIVREGRSFFGSLGEGVFNFGKLFTVVFVQIQAAVETFFGNFKQRWAEFSQAAELALAGDFKGAAASFKATSKVAFGEFRDAQKRIFDEAAARNPDLLKSWEELNTAVAEVDLTPAAEAQEMVAEASEAVTEALEAQIAALKRVENAHRKFSKNVEKLRAATIKGLEDLDKKAAASAQEIDKKQRDARDRFERESQKRRQELVEKVNSGAVEARKKLNRDLAQEQARFNLSRMQASRRFDVQDKRLRAEGSIEALRRLREDFDLGEQEARENFGLQRTNRTDEGNRRINEQKQEATERLAEFDAEIAERRTELRQAQDDELAALTDANANRREEFLKSQDERMQDLITTRNDELEELGRSLEDEANLTEEGMQAIAEKIAEVFGDEGAGVALVEGWNTRSTTLIGQFINESLAQLQALEDGVVETASNIASAMEAVRGTLSSPTAAGFTGSNPGSLTGSPRPRPQGMRHGGEGVVTGPATFNVEPGVREHVSFRPLPAVSDVRLSGKAKVDVAGMSDNVSSQTEERIADTIVEEIEVAVRRLSRR